jgi:hypothetical protein
MAHAITACTTAMTFLTAQLEWQSAGTDAMLLLLEAAMVVLLVQLP